METSVNLGGPLNAISLSPDGNNLIAAGRSVLKIVTVGTFGNTELKPSKDLRLGRTNLNYSSNDVKWHPMESHKNWIASAATNGAVVVWNIDRDSPKQEVVINDHSRTVNRVCWHPENPFSLLSGSQDGTMKLWDVRDPSSKIIFSARSESVRDVQFNNFFTNYFACGVEDGTLQIWDVRKPNQPDRKMTAHQGLVLSIDWHPDDKSLIASSGRDCKIKVWDLNGGKPVSTIQTISSVGRIRWRPGFRNQIASSGSVVDFDIHIWDIRRSYIPQYSIRGHRDVTTGFAWQRTSESLISCSKDSTLIYHDVNLNSYRPIEHICTTALSWSVNNNCLLTSEIINRRPMERLPPIPTPTAPPPPPVLPPFSLFSPTVSQPTSQTNVNNSNNSNSSSFNNLNSSHDFSVPKRNILVYSPIGDAKYQSIGLATEHFVIEYLAKSYKYTSLPFPQICEANALAAQESQQYQIAQTWLLIKALFEPLPKPPPKKIGPTSHSSTLNSSIPVHHISPHPSPRIHSPPTKSPSSNSSHPSSPLTSPLISPNTSNQKNNIKDGTSLSTENSFNFSHESVGAGSLSSTTITSSSSSSSISSTSPSSIIHNEGCVGLGARSNRSGSQPPIINSRIQSSDPPTPLSISPTDHDEERVRGKSLIIPENPLISRPPAADLFGSPLRNASIDLLPSEVVVPLEDLSSALLNTPQSASSSSPSLSLSLSSSVPIESPSQLSITSPIGIPSNLPFSNDSPSDHVHEDHLQNVTPVSRSVEQFHHPHSLVSQTQESNLVRVRSFPDFLTDNEDEEKNKTVSRRIRERDVKGSLGGLESQILGVVGSVGEKPRESTQQIDIAEQQKVLDHQQSLNRENLDQSGTENQLETEEQRDRIDNIVDERGIGNLEGRFIEEEEDDQDERELERLFPIWGNEEIVERLFDDYSQQGNVQMCVSLMLVLKDRISLNETRVNDWYFSYIDLLHRLKLFTPANKIIDCSPNPSIRSLNQSATTIYGSCPHCDKPLENFSYYCERCKKATSLCSICHQTVRGLYVWCQGCNHGGHLSHLSEWFSKNQTCPTGCSHVCTLSSRTL